MKRQLALLGYAVGSLRRRAGRSVALALGLAFVVALLSSVLFLTDALRREHRLASETLPDLTVQRMVAGRPALIEASHLDLIRGMPAVREVKARVWGYLYVAPLSANVTVVTMERDDPVAGQLAAGRMPARDGEMVAGTALAERLGITVGDDVAMPAPAEPLVLRTVGVFDAPSALYTADVVGVDEADARRLLGMEEGTATDLAVWLTTPDEADVIASRIREALPGARVLDRQLLARTYELTFDTRGGLAATLLLPALCAFLLLAWERLTGLGQAERYEIGVLKSVGWETGDVLSARIWENALLAASGTVLGIVVAYAYVFLFGAPGLAGTLFGWSNLYPPLTLVPAVDGAQVLALVGAVVVPFVGVSLVPAWRTATLDPDRALRGIG